MKIAVIGKGNVGGTLGSRWRAAGYDVVYGARDGGGEGPGGAPVRSIGDAIKDADVVVLTVPGQAVPDVANEHSAALAGKVVVDAVNRMGASEFDSRAIIAAAAPSARYVRAFNTLGWENFADPRFDGTPGDLFFSSAEADRTVVEALVDAVGLRPVYVGDGQHEVVDGVLRLWFALAIGQRRGRHLAFRVLDDQG
jgi:8-hydroxy-5-deazaflavin:NADPH oxidoreductase